jgi:SsrA-binding protein
MKTKTTNFENRRAKFDYHLTDEVEAGVILKGWEVKAIRAGQLTLSGSWVSSLNGNLLLHCEITPLIQRNTHLHHGHETTERQLLLSKKEKQKLLSKVSENGFSIIPTSAYFVGQWFKVKVALAKGKNNLDKRDTIKDREISRSLLQFSKQPNKNFV